MRGEEKSHELLTAKRALSDAGMTHPQENDSPQSSNPDTIRPNTEPATKVTAPPIAQRLR
jgi:hypothetical protein